MKVETQHVWARIHRDLKKANAGMKQAIEKLRKAGVL